VPGGERVWIMPKILVAAESLLSKWKLVLEEWVSQYPSHQILSLVLNIWLLVDMCEFEVGGIRLQTIVQCINSVFGIEMPTSMTKPKVWISVEVV
jgi:hypothetical protein